MNIIQKEDRYTAALRRKPIAEQILGEFFENVEGIVDVIVIMDGGRSFEMLRLEDHFSQCNRMYYRPDVSKKWKKDDPYFIGEPNQGHVLLLFDDVLQKGNAIKETLAINQAQGYKPDQRFVYIEEGIWQNTNEPFLKNATEMLEIYCE